MTEYTHTPDPIDVHVGARIRKRRLSLGMSQEKLSKPLGLTFQQVQKYENASNRVSASKLFKIASILEVSVMHFYEGVDPGGKIIYPVDDSPAARRTLELCRHFDNLNEKHSDIAFKLVRELAR